MKPEKVEVIRIRMQRATETLHEATVLRDAGAWPGVVSRTYYACFHAVNALLLTDDFRSPKHTGVAALFNMHYVKPGIVSTDSGRFYNNLLRRRTQYDYEDVIRADGTEARMLLDEAEVFIAEISTIVRDRLV